MLRNRLPFALGAALALVGTAWLAADWQTGLGLLVLGAVLVGAWIGGRD